MIRQLILHLTESQITKSQNAVTFESQF